jgi:hypothetical protein
VFRTTPHVDGHPAVLVRLEELAIEESRGLVTDAWLSRAPTRLAATYLAVRPPS